MKSFCYGTVCLAVKDLMVFSLNRMRGVSLVCEGVEMGLEIQLKHSPAFVKEFSLFFSVGGVVAIIKR